MILAFAGNHDHGSRPQIAQSGTYRRRSAPGAQHQRFFPRRINSTALQQIREPVHIRIIPVKSAVCPPDKRIHRPCPRRRFGKRIAVRDHRFFIWNRNVQAVKITCR